MKTNIYHVTFDNGEEYEDHYTVSQTIAANNAEEAISKFTACDVKYHWCKYSTLEAELVFENVTLNN